MKCKEITLITLRSYDYRNNGIYDQVIFEFIMFNYFGRILLICQNLIAT
jgi:hypothetical protein